MMTCINFDENQTAVLTLYMKSAVIFEHDASLTRKIFNEVESSSVQFST
jgi:hypothetical protein